jgi:ElaB/YqjD/DUF883 family membrane-anchored ribosome-binding protein
MKMRDWGTASAMESDQCTMDTLKEDVRTLATDMEQLLKATASQTGQQIAQVRARAEESMKAARVRLAEAQESALARTRAAARATDDYVRENPWQTLAIAAAAALLLGFLLARGSDSE